jgi:hypothetical protein
MNQVVITSIKGTGKSYRKVQNKLALICVGETIKIGGNWDFATGFTHFTTEHGITENDRVALENIILGLIDIFGDS